jgi:VIT1/CCC1 family predicted Fe2+/Mn2+ transporter
VLEPIDRVSEVLFGVIMALTFTCTLGVATAGEGAVRTMLFGALSCNLAWGIIDGGIYLMARLNERGMQLRTLRAIRDASDSAVAQQIIAENLPEVVVPLLPPEQFESLRQKLKQMPEPASGPTLDKQDGLAALAICALSFLSTFPIVIPFIFVSDARLALRVSNMVAIAMLFLCGYALGRYSGIRPWLAGVSMVAFGTALVGIAILLGG